MSIDQSVSGRAALHAALGEPTRLAIVDALALGDESPGVLADGLGIGTNLMAHHVATLESAGLVSRVRSEADRRRSYLHLHPDVLADLVPSRVLDASRVVFVCTHNSARSQLAAALWARSSVVPAASGGTNPARTVHPRATSTARRHGLALGRMTPQPIEGVVGEGDLVVTVCDSAHERLESSLVRRPSPALHWSIPDPVAVDTDEAFDNAYDDVSARVAALASAVHPVLTD